MTSTSAVKDDDPRDAQLPENDIPLPGSFEHSPPRHADAPANDRTGSPPLPASFDAGPTRHDEASADLDATNILSGPRTRYSWMRLVHPVKFTVGSHVLSESEYPSNFTR